MIYLTLDQVEALHRRALDEYGGLDGVRAPHQLAAAVSQPEQSAFGEDAYASVDEKAAAYGFFIAEAQAFVDGNKRTAAAAMLTFLHVNGYELDQPDDEIAEIFEKLGEGRESGRFLCLGRTTREACACRVALPARTPTCTGGPPRAPRCYGLRQRSNGVMTTNERENRPVARTAVQRRGWLTAAPSLVFCIALTQLTASPAVAAEQDAKRQKAAVTSLTFNGTDFFHRWSKAGQHEFTPQGDEDLKAWKEMVTINIHPRARAGEALAEVANRVLGNYEANGHIMRTLSKPRTNTSEAEHFIAAVLQAPQIFEVAFARLLLFEGRAVVAVYSKRFYGHDAQAEMTAWFKANAVPIESVLLNWNGIPSADTLNRLPQAR